jgi:hypothetical protein
MVWSTPKEISEELIRRAGPGSSVDPSTSWWAGAIHRSRRPAPASYNPKPHPHARSADHQTGTRPAVREGTPMEARHVQIHLRRCGVVVHHTAKMPPASDGRQAVVVFLEAGLQQYELARRCALKLPGVVDVTFSGHTSSIMYVFSAEPGGRTAPIRRPHPPSPNQRPTHLHSRREPVRVKRAPGPVPSLVSERRRTSAPPRN